MFFACSDMFFFSLTNIEDEFISSIITSCYLMNPYVGCEVGGIFCVERQPKHSFECTCS